MYPYTCRIVAPARVVGGAQDGIEGEEWFTLSTCFCTAFAVFPLNAAMAAINAIVLTKAPKV